jgi:hypothetical protein
VRPQKGSFNGVYYFPLWSHHLKREREFFCGRPLCGAMTQPSPWILFNLNFRNVGSALRIGYAYSGQMEMNAGPKRKPHQRDRRILTERAQRDQEEALDDAPKNTFPASDPVSIEQPAPPDADHD